MTGLSDVAAFDSAFGSVLSMFPLILLLFGFVFLITKVFVPMVSDGQREREKARIAKAKAQEESDQQRALVAKLIGLRSDFDDWLVDGLLALEIECAANPSEPKRAELLDALRLSKDNNAAQIESLHSGELGNLPTTAELGDIQHEWENLRNRLNLLPPTEATSAA